MIRKAALLVVITLLFADRSMAAYAREPDGPPHLAVSERGSIVEDVTVQTFGVIKRDTVRQYLSLKKGDAIDQVAIDRDYRNLSILAGVIPRLSLAPGTTPGAVVLHWIVMSNWLKPTSHPYYGDPPLMPSIQGVGFVLTSPPMNHRGANLSAISQLSRRADILRMLYTTPLHVNPLKGRESDFIVDVFGGRGVYRASQPLAINIYSWNTGAEALYLIRGTNGMHV